MSQPFLGQIIRVGFDFAPATWLKCEGQLLPISEFESLFTLIGNTYGGDAQNTFALPDLRGRAPLCMGQSKGTSNYKIGQNGGSETVTLTPDQLPSHQHSAGVITGTGNSSTPTPASLLADDGPAPMTLVYTYAPYDAANQTALNASSIGQTGGQPHENRQSFLVVTYCIATIGIIPTTN